MRPTTIAILASSLVLGPLQAGDTVHVSHHVHKLSDDISDGNPVSQQVDYGRLQTFCGDEDGCLVIVKANSTSLGARVGAQTARLFLDEEHATTWLSEGGSSPGRHFDSTGSTDTVAGTSDFLGGGCGLSDADAPSGTDTVLGFALTAIASDLELSVDCTLVIQD